MPDWFYRPVAQPVLFRLPDRAARGVALGVIGALGRSAAGRALIDFLGHMAPPPNLAVEIDGTVFASPFGLGWRVDPEMRGLAGLARFGVGCVEVRTNGRRSVHRDSGDVLEEVPASQLKSARTCAATVPLLRRTEENERETLTLPGGRRLPVIGVAEDGAGVDVAHGVVLQAGRRNAGGFWRVPTKMQPDTPEIVRAWRQRLGADAAIIVSGGVDCPADAVALVQAGASLLLIDGALVFRGPGFIKRCNEALQATRGMPEATAPRAGPMLRRAWPWACALGVALALGGAAALALALTRVLLPYDEHFLGLTAESLRRNSPRLFAFMAHDRATLAGTMLGLGWWYAWLGWQGIRRKVHGARTAVIASALTGFASFFAFFGFGYFDTLHAFVAVVLFQISVQVMVGEEGGAAAEVPPVDREAGAWRRAQWGQLLWIVHAVGLLIAGAVILTIGMTSVFVREDIAFLCLTDEQVRALDARLFGVVAHDRATLGGMLLASGVASLLPLLWCFRRGRAWLWTAMLGLGLPAYAAALGVHFWVGYTDAVHLVPAFAGLALWLGGLLCTRAYLTSGGLSEADHLKSA